jgi:LmbE family N-acetylglucosaminyl deacetylase
MHNQVRNGNEVYLLTLTKGGATKQRHKFGYSVEEMGNVRFQEMLNVSKVLNLTGMTVLDLPDSGLKLIDPRIIENAITEEVLRIKPDVVVTYPVHGISGFQDHLVTHAVVKRVFCELRDKHEFLKRLCFFTVNQEYSQLQKHFSLSYSTADEIKCVVEVEPEDIAKAIEALDCYVTFAETIEKSKIKEMILRVVHFEIFDEEHDKILTNIFQNLKQ